MPSSLSLSLSSSHLIPPFNDFWTNHRKHSTTRTHIRHQRHQHNSQLQNSMRKFLSRALLETSLKLCGSAQYAHFLPRALYGLLCAIFWIEIVRQIHDTFFIKMKCCVCSLIINIAVIIVIVSGSRSNGSVVPWVWEATDSPTIENSYIQIH